MDDKNSASGDTVKMEADDGKPNNVEDKENAMDGSTTNVIFFPSFLLQNYKGELFIKKDIYFFKQLGSSTGGRRRCSASGNFFIHG